MAEVDAQSTSSSTFGIQPVSGSRTPFGINAQCINKEMDEFSFRKILLNIDRNLLEKDILALKYLCLDKNIGVSHGELENVNRGLDILEKLERRGFLSKSKLEVLFELLGLIERYDLQGEVKKCLDLQQKMRVRQAKKISPYRAMILDFASDIGRKELESLKPILKPYIPAKTIERLNEPIEVMIELEKLTVISPQKVKFLFQVADYLQSEDLVHKLKEFKDNIQPKSHGDSESMSPVTDVSDSPAQPANHGDTEQTSLIQNGSTQDAIQCDTESLSPATDILEGSVYPNNHRDTEPPVATIASTQTESQENTKSATPVSIREKCWHMTMRIFLIGGIVIIIIFGLMAILLEDGLGKKISTITTEIGTTVTLIGFIMVIYDKCNAPQGQR